MNITFEKLGNTHQKEVMDIFNYYVENSFAAFSETRLPDIFFEKIMEKIQDYPAYAIKDSDTGAIAGFCYLSAYHPFPTFKHTAQISYFILPHYTHAGAGKMSLDILETDAKKRGIRTILADISSKNTGLNVAHNLKKWDINSGKTSTSLSCRKNCNPWVIPR